MKRSRKQLLVAGIVLLFAGAALFGYVYYGEYETRSSVRAPSGTGYGFIPLDLLQGRTRFEKRVDDQIVFSLDTGPRGESRIALARAAFGVGALGAALLVFGALTKAQPKP